MTSPSTGLTRAGDSAALVVTELTLIAVSLAAIVSLERLFLDNTWRRPIIFAALAAHLIAMVLRRLPVPAVLTPSIYGAAGLVVLTHLNYSSTTRRGLPSGTTLDSFRADLTLAADTLPDAIAPTPALSGFVVVAAAVVWVLIWVADSLAFQFRLTLTALAPAAGIIVFVASLGSETRRTPLLLLALAAAIVFIVTHRSLLFPAEHTWLGNLSDARASLARFAAPVAVIAGLFTVTALPLIPGASDSLIDFNSSGPGDPARVVISPLVDVRGRIVSQADVEVFQVRSDEPSYWRLTSLDTFDNAVWSSRADYDAASGNLDLEVQSGTRTHEVSQQFRIEALAAVWLPAAFQPTNITNLSESGLKWEPGSATLIVDRSRTISDGIEYTIQSAVPDFTSDELDALPFGYPEGFEHFVELPADFSPETISLAADVTEGATSPYEISLALQTFFRSEFTYDINVATGHDLNRIEDFLAVRAGYCEQFAGTFAAMARSLGLPARVAVGFTWGDSDPNDPTLFRVRGEHAHAWPEVFIDGAGWIAFEPTPGRGAPYSDYTGFSAAQDETGISEAFQGSALNPALQQPPSGFLGQLNRGEETSGLSVGDERGTTSTSSSFEIPGWVFIVAAVFAGLAAIFAMAPWASRALRGRRHRHTDPSRHRVLKAWDSVIGSVAPIGIRPVASETSSEFVERIVPVLGPQPELGRLAGSVDHARYSPTPVSDAAISQAESALSSVAMQVHSRTSWWQRYRAEVNLRALFRRS